MALDSSIGILLTILQGLIQVIKIIRLIKNRRQRLTNNERFLVPPLPNVMIVLQTILLIMKIIRLRRKRRGKKTKISKLITLLRGYRYTSVLKLKFVSNKLLF